MKLLPIILFCLVLSGCVAKSSHVDDLTAQYHKLTKKLSSDNPNDEEFRVIERDAYVLAKESSSLVDDAAVEKIVGFIGSLLSKLLGFDISTYLYIILGAFGVGGTAKVVVDKKKKKKDDEDKEESDRVYRENLNKKMTALAEMPPEHANKIKDVI